jgi:exopolysaccharide biosynthesis polyprenyl glycosylphosphotransferase
VSEDSAEVVLPPVRKARTRDWRNVYSARLSVTDLLVLIWVVFGVQIAWFGFDTTDVTFRGDRGALAVSYTAVSLAIITSWMLMLSIFGTREFRILGTGPDEYKLIASASIRLFGLLAIVAYLFRIDFARGYILIAFPFGMVVLMFSRWMWRQWLSAQRQHGRFSARVLLVGSASSAERIAGEFARQPAAGYVVVGACVPSAFAGAYLDETTIPVLGDIDELQLAIEVTGADTVVVTSSGDISPERMRQLSWSLEPGRQHLVVVPSLTDIGGPRIHTRPVAGLPLIHVETPSYEGRKLFTKRALDIVVSAILIVLLSPFFAASAIAVRLSGPGPVLFRQYRVGINGIRFTVLKFRSMVPDAEAKLAALRHHQRAEGNTVMFKMKDDPRITPVGRFIRRFSLDELPQLFNVFGGSMSLVGPRPPLQSEVAMYETHVHRRFLVKPGITGLWQVSGRSNLSWEDSVRLDLYYVENWSLAGDLVILWRTTKAVLSPRGGAY